MKKLFLFLSMSVLFMACTKYSEDTSSQVNSISKNSPIICDISTFRTVGNISDSDFGMGQTKSSSSDPFTESREIESSESVVLPELIPHIWVGNILKKSSIADMQYKPMIYPRSPITLSTTLPNTIPMKINNPSFSSVNTYIQSQINTGSFSQSGEFSMTVEQFTSYNELKVAFGSNVNTSGLFWGNSTTTEGYDHKISKATGLYIKFFQTSFKTVMDYPSSTIADIPNNLIDSAVYINSVTYGRLGILTLETNYSAELAKGMITKIFHAFFVNGASTLTEVEQNFLNGSEFKLYLIGGNSSTSVESFQGYLGFINHIKKGAFSKEEPGVPLFCSYAHVNDNSPVSIKFKFNIRKQPIYVEMMKKDKDLVLYFYQNQNKVPTIAHPNIEFRIKQTTVYNSEWPDRVNDRITETVTTVQNAGYQTSLIAVSNVLFYKIQQLCKPGGREGQICEIVKTWDYTFSLEDSPNYQIVGQRSYSK